MIENFNKSSMYARSLFIEDEKIAKIKKEAILEKVPIITEEALSFLLFMANNKQYKKGLEIGTAIGYSTYYLSKYLKMTSIEIDEKRYEKAVSNLNKLGCSVNLILGDAIYEIEKLEDKFDFIFIDASKGQYKKFFDLCYNKLNNGGIIFIDNIMFRSYITDENYPKKYKTIVNRLNEFINYLNTNYNFTLIPFADGVGLVKKGEL